MSWVVPHLALHAQGNIEKVSVSRLESYKADLWLLAPPCQPYTRRGLQKDADDWRASSFMQLLSKLPQLEVRRVTSCNHGLQCHLRAMVVILDSPR